MRDINALVEKYCRRAVQFAFVYILEAHASDEWPVPREECVDLRQHRSMLDRARAAQLLAREYPLHPELTLLLDNRDNAFNAAYASWPFRYWIVQDGRVALKMIPVDGDKANLQALADWLKRGAAPPPYDPPRSAVPPASKRQAGRQAGRQAAFFSFRR